MRLLRLIWANSIRLLTQPGNIIFLIGVPVGILLFQNLLMSGDGTGASGLMVQNLDRGVYAEPIPWKVSTTTPQSSSISSRRTSPNRSKAESFPPSVAMRATNLPCLTVMTT